jgi:hypothetical protein
MALYASVHAAAAAVLDYSGALTPLHHVVCCVLQERRVLKGLLGELLQ